MDSEQERTLLREFAETEPVFSDEDGDTNCLYCSAREYALDADGHYTRILQPLRRHESSCLWRRACEALGVVPPDDAPPPAPAPFDPVLAQVWAPLLMKRLRARLDRAEIISTDMSDTEK